MTQREPIVLLKPDDGANSSELNDTTFAKYAEDIIKNNIKKPVRGKNQPELPFPGLSTTKLRSIYGLITNIYTKINQPEDFNSRQSDIQYLKVKMAYEAGRDAAVKTFLDKTKLMKAVDNIKSYDQFLLYCRYAESLVAYFKFYGGRDN